MFLRNENDTLLTDRDDIVEELAQYFDQLQNCREPSNPFLFENKEPNRGDYPEPTIEEIAKQIKTLKTTRRLVKTGLPESYLKQVRRILLNIFIV